MSEHKPEPRIISRIKAHERSIIVFGAFLIAGTFLLKEWIGEDVRDFEDAVHNAEVSFRARGEYMNIKNVLDRVDGRVGAVRDMMMGEKKESKSIVADPSFPQQPGEHKIPYYSLKLTELRMPLDEKISNFEEILEYIHLPKESQARFEDTKRFLDSLDDDANALDEGQLLDAEKEKKAMNIYTGIVVADDDLNQLTPIVLKAAKQEEEKRERQYSRCKRLNALCFIVGLLFAVIGRVYHFEVFASPA